MDSEIHLARSTDGGVSWSAPAPIDPASSAGLDVDLDSALTVWDDAMALPGARDVVPARWLHADIAAENLLVRGDRLAAPFGRPGVPSPCPVPTSAMT